MSVPSDPPSGDVQKTAAGITLDDLLARNESAGRRGAEKVNDLFKKAIASKLEQGTRP